MYIARRYSPSYVAILLYSLADPPHAPKLVEEGHSPIVYHRRAKTSRFPPNPVLNHRERFSAFISFPPVSFRSLFSILAGASNKRGRKHQVSKPREMVEFVNTNRIARLFVVREIDVAFRSWREVGEQVSTMRTREGMQEMMVDRDGARGPRGTINGFITALLPALYLIGSRTCTYILRRSS